MKKLIILVNLLLTTVVLASPVSSSILTCDRLTNTTWEGTFPAQPQTAASPGGMMHIKVMIVASTNNGEGYELTGSIMHFIIGNAAAIAPVTLPLSDSFCYEGGTGLLGMDLTFYAHALANTLSLGSGIPQYPVQPRLKISGGFIGDNNLWWTIGQSYLICTNCKF